MKNPYLSRIWLSFLLAFIALTTLLLVGCQSAGGTQDETERSAATIEALQPLTLPQLSAVPLDGRKLKVVATTSIIGDVVANVGRDAIDLTVLMEPGQDPHSYEPAARDLTAAAEADVLFVNGWDLEQALAGDLRIIGESAAVVPVSAGIEPLSFTFDEHGAEAESEDEHEHEQGAADPHVWFRVANVMRWTDNVEQVLSTLDPANAERYATNAADYHSRLAELDAFIQEQVATIPTERHVLVTNHDTFGYFADAYGFRILGTILPASSTVAEPSASDLAGLVETMTAEDVCTLFAENTVSDRLVQTISKELSHCAQVQVLHLYTDSLGAAGSGADSYIGMVRSNVETIVNGLR